MVVYGDELTAEPMFVLSTLNCTLATATLSEAVADSATLVPETVAPLDGAVSETVGGVVSGVGVGDDDAGLPPPPKPGVYPAASGMPPASGMAFVAGGGVELVAGVVLGEGMEAGCAEATVALVSGPKKPVAGNPLAD